MSNGAAGQNSTDNVPAVPPTGGLTGAQQAALVGQVFTAIGGIVEQIIRIEGNNVQTASGGTYDLATVLQLMQAQQAAADARREEERQRREDEKTDWTPWIAAAGVGLVLFMVGMRRD